MSDKARELLERALNFFEEICDSRSIGIEKSINAYLAEPEVKPLSDEEIVQAYEDASFIGTMTAFVAGVRFAEKHHGIGGRE